jgi:hypothetical protein
MNHWKRDAEARLDALLAEEPGIVGCTNYVLQLLLRLRSRGGKVVVEALGEETLEPSVETLLAVFEGRDAIASYAVLELWTFKCKQRSSGPDRPSRDPSRTTN